MTGWILLVPNQAVSWQRVLPRQQVAGTSAHARWRPRGFQTWLSVCTWRKHAHTCAHVTLTLPYAHCRSFLFTLWTLLRCLQCQSPFHVLKGCICASTILETDKLELQIIKNPLIPRKAGTGAWQAILKPFLPALRLVTVTSWHDLTERKNNWLPSGVSFILHSNAPSRLGWKRIFSFIYSHSLFSCRTLSQESFKAGVKQQ